MCLAVETEGVSFDNSASVQNPRRHSSENIFCCRTLLQEGRIACFLSRLTWQEAFQKWLFICGLGRLNAFFSLRYEPFRVSRKAPDPEQGALVPLSSNDR